MNAIKELVDAGATCVVIHSGNFNQLETIDFYEKEVLPAIRSGQVVTA